VKALFRVSSACLRRWARRRNQKKRSTKKSRAFADPSEAPMIAPFLRPFFVTGAGAGSVSRYGRLKTMPVMTVRPEMLGVVSGTGVIEGTEKQGVVGPSSVGYI
jgi:hypothetical protein